MTYSKQQLEALTADQLAQLAADPHLTNPERLDVLDEYQTRMGPEELPDPDGSNTLPVPRDLIVERE